MEQNSVSSQYSHPGHSETGKSERRRTVCLFASRLYVCLSKADPRSFPRRTFAVVSNTVANTATIYDSFQFFDSF